MTLSLQDIVPHIEVADSPYARMKGLLGRDGLGKGRALLLSPCGSIHTFFMRFPLDLVILDRGSVVTRTVFDVGPGRVVRGGAGAWSVLEMEAGWFPRDAVCPGDVVSLDPRRT